MWWQSGQSVQPRKSVFVFWFVLTVRGWLHCGQFLAEALGFLGSLGSVGSVGCIFSSFRSGLLSTDVPERPVHDAVRRGGLLRFFEDHWVTRCEIFPAFLRPPFLVDHVVVPVEVVHGELQECLAAQRAPPLVVLGYHGG